MASPSEKPAARETAAARSARMAVIIKKLRATYPDAKCALTFSNPLELLVATILSAQCTDVRVNLVTPALFKKYRSAKAYMDAPATDIEELIRTAGFYRAKARSIQGAARAIVEKHGGEVPRTMEELHALPGVGRKTANVVLGNAFGIDEGIVVDTHVRRLSQRLGFTREEDPVKIEEALVKLAPRETWTLFSHLLIFHGRQRCFARNPDCLGCEIKEECPSFPKLSAEQIKRQAKGKKAVN